MRQRGGLLRHRDFLVPAICISFLLLHSASTLAQTYVHDAQLSFTWDPASGSVDHYNVYLSLEGQPFGLLTEVPANTCRFEGEDGKSYVVQVEAEDASGNTGPISDPSEKIVVYLSGSEDDTDGDGMPDTWEATYGLNPFDPADGGEDPDGDGLVNCEECAQGTLPTEADTDGDGVQDAAEVLAQQNPLDPTDNIPVAVAGPDQTLDPAVVELDGSGSFDPNGDPLSYAWLQVEGSEVTLSDPHSVRPTFLETAWGRYGFKLVVNDGKAASSPDEVLISIRNVPPTADAGPDRVVDAGTRVILDGSSTRDANGDTIHFSWKQIEGPSVPLQGADQEKASFEPEISGVHEFELVAFDGDLYSQPDHVQVVVNALNRVPTADAGYDQTVPVDVIVTLDGSGSTDPEEDPLDYLWSQLEGPEPVFLEGASTAYASFTPGQAGAYRFQLIVSDGTDASPPDQVTVTAVSENNAPVAVTSGPSSVEVGDSVALDGTASYDPDGDALTYQWTQTGGVQVALQKADTAVAGFQAVSEGVFRFELTVHDGELPSEPATFEVTVNGTNQVPIADAGKRLRGRPGKEITLDGSASYDQDPGDTLTYAWSQVQGPLVTLYDADTATPRFTPSNGGIYVFELRVSDGQGRSAPDRVIVWVYKAKWYWKDH